MQVPAAAAAPAAFGSSPPPPFASGALGPPPLPSSSTGAPLFTPPPPPPPKEDDPFAFLKDPSAPPPAKPSPFAEGYAPQPVPPAFGAPVPAAGINPYAAPAGGYAGAYSGGMPQYGPRTGLPWEVRGQSFGSWWETMSLIIGSPNIAFSRMRQTGGLGSPIMFSVWGMGVPMALMLCIAIPVAILLGVGAGQEEGAGVGIGVGAGMVALFVIGAIVYVFFVATIGALIGAAIYHLSLLIVGGARQPFETTFRVLSFSQGAMMPVGIVLGFIPYIGPLIQMVWVLALMIIGLSRAHEIPGGKAAMAVLLPFGAIMACCFAFVFLSLVGGLANQ
jgi:hypothetical protein